MSKIELDVAQHGLGSQSAPEANVDGEAGRAAALGLEIGRSYVVSYPHPDRGRVETEVVTLLGVPPSPFPEVAILRYLVLSSRATPWLAGQAMLVPFGLVAIAKGAIRPLLEEA